MTDRYSAVVVIFEKDIREDDAEVLIGAWFRGVLDVKPQVANLETLVAEARAKSEVRQKIYDVLRQL